MASDGPKSHVLPIEHVVAESLTTRLANNMTVQIDPGGVYLSFFETVPPLLTGGPDEARAKLEAMKSVRAECFARVFVPGPRVAEFLKALDVLKAVSWDLPSLPLPKATTSEVSEE
jgi:hypothetical protein